MDWYRVLLELDCYRILLVVDWYILLLLLNRNRIALWVGTEYRC